MSYRELDRLSALQRYLQGGLTQVEAACQLGLSERQIRRLLRRLEAEGPTGLASRRRGRPSNNRLAPETLARALGLVRDRYPDFGPTFAAEKLRELHGFRLSTESLRQAMIASGMWQSRAQPRVRRHPPRERRACFGELVQLDGSHHAWFEHRGPRCVLLTAVDDATSTLMAAYFDSSESSQAYFALLRSLLLGHGRPLAVYTDHHSVFTITRELAGQTQVGRALRELSIELICATTPQAKGRVERVHQTLQHRLLRELRLAGIDNVTDANTFLPPFIDDYNRRFAVAARCEHSALRDRAAFDLDYILTQRYTRTLTKHLTFQVGRDIYQLTDVALPARLHGAKIEIDFADGMRVTRRGITLPFNHIQHFELPKALAATELAPHFDRRRPNPKKAHAPAPNHPWRLYRPHHSTEPLAPDNSTLA